MRIKAEGANPVDGRVVFDWSKATWNIGLIIATILLTPFFTNIYAVIVSLLLTYFSLLGGHSVGMHRMMIHRTFRTPVVVERVLVYIGVLVGMGGPLGIIKIHDVRDWAQRQSECHDFFSHRRGLLTDLWWQLTSKFEFIVAPKIEIETQVVSDPFYRFLEKTWRMQQLPLVMMLYYMGGMPFVVWGVLVRIPVSVVGHWTITYFCHNPGPGTWLVKDACVQASNIPGLGVVTFGECWHNNHHAFPESAKIGIEPNQCDPAWRLIQALSAIGCATDVGLPRSAAAQDDLVKIRR